MILQLHDVLKLLHINDIMMSSYGIDDDDND